MKQEFSKNKGFALIYALLFVLLISITITMMTVLTLSEKRQTRHSQISVRAYQLAQSAIEDGINYLNGSPAGSRTATINMPDGKYSYTATVGSPNTVTATGYANDVNNTFSTVNLRATKSGNGYVTQQY